MNSLLWVALALAAPADDCWPAFRGHGDSISIAANLPLTWSSEENIAWSVPLDGYGQSSPVVWQQRVFVTSAEGEKKEKLLVACYALDDGRRLWQHTGESAQPIEVSDYVSRAAPTPVVDAQRVYALFESGDLVALDHEGQVAWQRSLATEYGSYQGNHGLGASLAITDKAVIVLYEHDAPSYLLAIDKDSGENLWKVDRPARVSWSSPVVSEGADGAEIIVSSNGVVEGFAADSGKRLWWLEGLEGNTVASATATAEQIVVASSEAANNVVLRRGGAGDVSQSHVAWRSEEASSSFGSPLVYQGNVYFVNRAGAAFCLDLQDGTEHWRQRLPGSCWASPVGAEGRVYFFTKEGTTLVAKAADEFEQLAENELPADRVYGVAAVNGAWIVREGSRLTRIGASGESVALARKPVSQEADAMGEFPDLPQGLTSFGAARVDNWLYVCGGHIGQGHDYNVDTQTDAFRRLNLNSPDKWESLPSIGRLQGLALVAHGGKLYRMGGFEARNADGEDQDLWSSKEVACYDPATGQWQKLTDMPSRRSSHDAVVLGDKVYVVGGWAMQGPGEYQWQQTALVADLSQQPLKWQELPAPPFERRALVLAAWQGKIYAIGGMQSNNKTTTAVACFDPATDTWSEAPNLPGESLEGFGAAACGTDEGLFVSTIGGSLLKLDSDAGQWSVMGKLKSPRFFHRMLPLADGRLLAVGGADMSVGKIPSLEVLPVR